MQRIGMKRTASESVNSKSSPHCSIKLMRKRNSRTEFAVCICNTGYEASLEVGKIYEVIPDAEADRHGYLRVIDESGEDYWHPAKWFFAVALPRKLEKTLAEVYRAA